MFGFFNYVNENTDTTLNDDDVLIFSSIDSLKKFGYKPHDEISENNLNKLFESGKKAKFFVHYCSASSEDDNIKIAHIDNI